MLCAVCGIEIYTSPDATRCFGCASGYKSLKPTSRPVVPSDCVSKSDLRKIVIEAPQPECSPDEDCKECAELRAFVEKLKNLLNGEPNDNP